MAFSAIGQTIVAGQVYSLITFLSLYHHNCLKNIDFPINNFRNFPKSMPNIDTSAQDNNTSSNDKTKKLTTQI